MRKVTMRKVDRIKKLKVLLKQKGDCSKPEYFYCGYSACPIYDECDNDTTSKYNKIYKLAIQKAIVLGIPINDQEVFEELL